MQNAGKTAQAPWELENNVQQVEDVDSLFRYDQQEQQAIQQQKPWSKDPNYFKQYALRPSRSSIPAAASICMCCDMQLTKLAGTGQGTYSCMWHLKCGARPCAT